MRKTRIDWCDSTWNPISGCLKGCDYCYASKIAKRFASPIPEGFKCSDTTVELETQAYKFDGVKNVKAPYPYGFTPTFHKYKLGEPKKWIKPSKIFVGSMADIFGEWVPDEWIKQIFDACLQAPRHTYFFLTKNPARYVDLAEKGILPMEKNFWFGSTTPTMKDRFFFCYPRNTFICIEPILEPFVNLVEEGINPVTSVDWVIVGAETGQRLGKVVPKKEWVMELAQVAKQAKIPIFMKDSLREIMGDDFVQETPFDKKKGGTEERC